MIVPVERRQHWKLEGQHYKMLQTGFNPPRVKIKMNAVYLCNWLELVVRD